MGHGKRFSPGADDRRRRGDGHAARRHHGEESRAAKRARERFAAASPSPAWASNKEIAHAAPCCWPVRSPLARRRGRRARRRHAPQTESDAYTRYELLAPGSAKFRIIYEVTANTAGATYYFNPIRKGSVATDESVFDRATGKPLAVRRRRQRGRARRRRAQQRHDADVHSREARASGAARRRRGRAC